MSGEGAPFYPKAHRCALLKACDVNFFIFSTGKFTFASGALYAGTFFDGKFHGEAAVCQCFFCY